MKKRNVLYLVLTVILPVFGLFSSSYSGGITGQSTTGCSGGSCHAPNLSTTNLSITGIPSAGYVGGTTYTLVATVANPNYIMSAARGGFNISCTEGSFSATSGVLVPSPTEITHSIAKAMTSASVSWNISWTAPVGGSGTTIFHFAGNAANGNFNNTGDQPNYDPFPFTEATVAGVPTITGVSSSVTHNSAMINAMVNANGNSTVATVEYGLTTAYGSSQAATPSPITGNTSTAVSATLAGLTPNTTYHYRVTATNSAGTSNGTDNTFTTSSNVAVKEFEKSNYTIAPNPSMGIVQLSFTNDINVSSLEIFSLSGQKIMTPSISMQQKSFTIDLSNVAQGTYILHANINGKLLMQKICKL